MKKTFALAIACIGLAAQAQTIQPGLWEFKHDMQMPGQPDRNAQMAQMREQMNKLVEDLTKGYRDMAERGRGEARHEPPAEASAPSDEPGPAGS